MESSVDLVSEGEEDDSFTQTHPDEPPFKKRNLYFTTPEQSISFMSVFQKYEVLYGKTFDQSKSVRDHAWFCISDELDVPINALKARWRCIKDTHTKVKRKKVGTGWYLMPYLGFLDGIKNETNPNNDTFDGFPDDVVINQNSAQGEDINAETDDNSQNHKTPPDKFEETLTPKITLKQIKVVKVPIKSETNQSSGINLVSKPPPLRLIKTAEIIPDTLEFTNDILDYNCEDDDPLDVDEKQLEDRQINPIVSLEEEEAAYGFHIGRQLRQFPIYEREILRHKINSLIYQAFMNLKSN